MYEGFDLGTFFMGLPLGITIALIISFFVWRKGKKERRFDERYENIQRHAKSIGWGATTIAILIGWAIVIIVEGAGPAFFILMGIYVVHMLSYIVGGVVANAKN